MCREQYYRDALPDNQYEMTGADPLGYEHLLVLFIMIAIGIGLSATIVFCEIGSTLWKRKCSADEAMMGEVPKRRRASI